MTRVNVIPAHLTNRAGIAAIATLGEAAVEARNLRERGAEHGPDRLAELTAQLAAMGGGDPRVVRPLLLQLTATAVLELAALDLAIQDAAAGPSVTPRLAAVAHG